MSNVYQVLSERIYSDFPIFGSCIRQRAAVALSKDKSPNALKILAEAVVRSGDRKVITIALEALRNLRDQKSIDVLCKSWVESQDSQLQSLIRKRNYQPSEAITKALFYFLLGEWQKYEDLDFNQSLLSKAYQSASQELQKKIVERARKSGRIELIKILTSAKNGFDVAEITDQSWEAFVDILEVQLDRKEIWRFLYNAPAIYSKKLLDRLAVSSFEQFLQEDKDKLKVLLSLSRKTKDNDFMLIRYLDIEEPKYLDIPELSSSRHTFAISPDGDRLALCDYDYFRLFNTRPTEAGKNIRLYSLPDGDHIQTFLGNTHELNSLWNLNTDPYNSNNIAISPNGHIILASVGSMASYVHLWSLSDGNYTKIFYGHGGHGGGITSLAISPDGHILALARKGNSSEGAIYLYSLPNGNHIKTIKYDTKQDAKKKRPDFCHSLAISPDGCILAAYIGPCIGLYSLPDGNYIKTLYSNKPCFGKDLVISSNGRFFATNNGRLFSTNDNQDGNINLWSLPDGNHIKSLKRPTVGDSDTLAISPDGCVLVSNSGSDINLWSLPDGKLIKTLHGVYPNLPLRLAFSDNGCYILLALRPKYRKLSTGHERALWALWSIDNHNIPISQLTSQDIKKIKSRIQSPTLDEGICNALKFTLALIDLRQQFDIDIEDSSNDIPSSEFDIEIE